MKLGPASLPRPETIRLLGRASDPLRNAVAFGPTANSLDALTSLGGAPMCFGQVVPFEAVIGVSGIQGPGHGTMEFTVDWSTYTTSNDRFGFDTNYMVYCAFVDTADPGTHNPNNYARVDSFSSRLVNAGTIDEQIEGTFRVSGLDVGDQVVVEIWLVLMTTARSHVSGTIAAQLISAQALDPIPSPLARAARPSRLGICARWPRCRRGNSSGRRCRRRRCPSRVVTVTHHRPHLDGHGRLQQPEQLCPAHHRA